MLTSRSVENDTMSISTNPPVNAAHYSRLASAGEEAVLSTRKEDVCAGAAQKKGQARTPFFCLLMCCSSPPTHQETEIHKQQQQNGTDGSYLWQ